MILTTKASFDLRILSAKQWVAVFLRCQNNKKGNNYKIISGNKRIVWGN